MNGHRTVCRPLRQVLRQCVDVERAAAAIGTFEKTVEAVAAGGQKAVHRHAISRVAPPAFTADGDRVLDDPRSGRPVVAPGVDERR
jgi:hypothetical protein